MLSGEDWYDQRYDWDDESALGLLQGLFLFGLAISRDLLRATIGDVEALHLVETTGGLMHSAFQVYPLTTPKPLYLCTDWPVESLVSKRSEAVMSVGYDTLELVAAQLMVGSKEATLDAFCGCGVQGIVAR